MAPSTESMASPWAARFGQRRALVDGGTLANATYRFGRWRASLPAGLLRKVLRVPYLVAHRFVRNRYRIEVHYTASLGRGVRVSGRGDIVIGNQVVVGHGCSIGHGVTIGKTRHDARGWPVIGDRVTVGPGAVVVGDISVGDDAVIGPNSVVLADVPATGRVSARPAVSASTVAPAPDAAPGDTAAPPSGRLPDAVRPAGLSTRSVEVARSATVGVGVRFHRDGNASVGEGAVVGDDCIIGYGVTIGWSEREPAQRPETTRLGDRVVVDAGTTILAGVSVGDDAWVGPNAVVATDVPAGAHVVCPPAATMRSLRRTET